MLSKEGFVHHIMNIENSSNMYNTYKSALYKESIEMSRIALIRHFEEQEREIRKLHQMIECGITFEELNSLSTEKGD